MSEWWTYRLSSFLLFSPRTYFRLHELYNVDFWPLHVVALGLGVALLFLARRAGRWQRLSIFVILAMGWAWVAWAFHLQRYATINWAATYFAAAFAIEALLLILLGVIGHRAAAPREWPLARRVGLGALLFALFVQPTIGPLFGRSFIQSEIFGVAPDPTVIGTLGILLLLDTPAFAALVVIPVIWCMVSGALQWAMGSPDAWVTPLAGVVVLLAAVTRSIRRRSTGTA